MNIITDLVLKIPKIFIDPKGYFNQSIVNRRYENRDLVYLGAFFCLIFVILNWIAINTTDRFTEWIQIFIYLGGVFWGFIVSVMFRTYFITMILNKVKIEVDYKKVALILIVSSVMSLIYLLGIIIFKIDNQIVTVEELFKVLTLIFVFIGIKELAGLSVKKGIWIVLILYGFEIMFKFAISGIV